MRPTSRVRPAERPIDASHYREIFEGVQDIIYVRDMEGVLLEVNEAGVRFFGKPREQLIGSTFHRRLDDEQARSLKATNELLAREGVDRSTVEFRNGAGEVRTLEATTALIRGSDGAPMGAYGVMRDVTDSMRLHRSLAETNDALIRVAGVLTLEKERTERALAEATKQRENAERANALLAADHARKTQELEEARLLHLSLLPAHLPQVAHVEVAVHMANATEVGGDYYDFSVGDDGALTVAFGDATGHGLRSGILMATAKSYFQTLGRRAALRDILEAMSGAFRNLGIPSLYMCLMLMRIHERQISVLGAGMPSFLVRRPSAPEIERVEVAGTPLGVHGKTAFDGRIIDFDPGTVALFFSDGLPDLADEFDEELGYEPIERCLSECADDDSATRVLGRVVDLAAKWRGVRPAADDITILVMRAV